MHGKSLSSLMKEDLSVQRSRHVSRLDSVDAGLINLQDSSFMQHSTNETAGLNRTAVVSGLLASNESTNDEKIYISVEQLALLKKADTDISPTRRVAGGDAAGISHIYKVAYNMGSDQSPESTRLRHR